MDVAKIKFGWDDVAKYGVMLASVLGVWFTMSGDVRETRAELHRIKTETIPEFVRMDRELTAGLVKVRDDMATMRLSSTELLAELRADMRHMRAVLERIERAQAPPPPPGGARP